MIQLRAITQVLEEWAPPQWADSYDNVGLLWGDPTRSIQGVLTTLDVTPAVLQEAKAVGADLIIAHHPIWFGSRTRLRWDTYADKLIYQLIQADVSVYAIHTNADQASMGVNHALCRLLQLHPIRFLREEDSHHGAGYIGELPQPLSPVEFFRHLQSALQVPILRFSKGPERPILRVAVCGGAGSFLLPEALAGEVEAFLTADIPYHRFFEAEGRLWLVDIGHYESEQMIGEVLAEVLRRHFPTLPIFATRVRTNPVHYWV
ncbi:MAG: Nif3-like dinuclear metal center hexameric protein [Bacteroidia bacterium]|nr:Nif3-like dinuclear metal center hexameric protein [Bacteroidia bacterium]